MNTLVRANLSRAIGLTIMATLLASVTVPYYCATGWCCGKDNEPISKAKEARCCCVKQTGEQMRCPVRASDSCCNGEDTDTNSGCPMGCAKLATSVFVLVSDVVEIPNLNEELSLQEIAQAIPSDYIDSIPKPPLTLSA